MATDDQQVLVTGTASAPASFTIPGNGQIRPKAVFASYDGTGAAAAFLPALKVVSDGGEVVGIYPTQTQVAAGASADVSWFPWLAAGAAAGPAEAAAMPYASVLLGSWNWTVGGGFVSFTGASVGITDTSVFTNNILSDPTTPLLINKAGIYIAWSGIGPWNPAWGTQAQLSNLGPDFGSWAGMGNAADNYPVTFTPVGGISGASPALLMVTRAIYTTDPPGGGQVRMEVAQNSGATRNVGAAIHIIRLTGNGAGI